MMLDSSKPFVRWWWLGGPFRDDLKAFNAYLERVSAALREGGPVSRLAVYLPNEDYMRLHEPPLEERAIAEQDYWEMRRVEVPAETEGHHPLWVSESLLREATAEDGRVVFEGIPVDALYVDADWLDAGALAEILRLARRGARVAMIIEPQEPGRTKTTGYRRDLEELSGLSNVVRELKDLRISPLLEGERLPWYWARESDAGLLLFVAHPAARNVRYPMAYGQSAEAGEERRELYLDYNGKRIPLTLDFKAYESILVRVDPDGRISFEDLGFTPPHPKQSVEF